MFTIFSICLKLESTVTATGFILSGEFFTINLASFKEMFLGEQDVMLKRWEVEFEKLSKARAEINYRLDKLEKEMSSVH